MRKDFLFLTCTLLSLTACTRQPQGAGRTATVEDFSNAEFADKARLPRMKACLHVEADSSQLPLSDAQDVAIDGETCYVLDGQSVLTAFSLRDGHILAQTLKLGRGAGEYVSPMAIDACADTLYVEDKGKMAIICYDRDLQAVGTYPLADVALDFARVEGGFLCLSLSERLTLRLTLADEAGHTTALGPEGRLEADMLPSVNDCIVRDSKGEVYVKIPMEETVYRLDGQTFAPAWDIVYRGEKSSSDFDDGEAMLLSGARHTSCFFVRDDALLLSFPNDGKLCFAYTSAADGQSVAGIVPARKGGAAFCPRWQSGHTLVSVETDEAAGDGHDGWLVCAYQF